MHLEVEEETPVPVATETPVLKVAPCGGRSTRGELPKKQRPMPRKHERDLLDEFHRESAKKAEANAQEA